MIKLLTLSLIALLMNMTFAQNAVVTIQFFDWVDYSGSVPQADLYTHDFSGEQIDLRLIDNVSEALIQVNFSNETGSEVEWRVSRRRLNYVPTWQDYIVYGESSQFGVALPSDVLDMEVWTPPFNTTFVFSIDTNQVMAVTPHFIPDPTIGGCSHYRYYVGTEADPFIDSVDINICSTLSIDEFEASNVEVFPNPASDEITILSDFNNPEIQILDVLGNVVISNKTLANNTLNVAELKNGVYFILLQEDGQTPIQKKILIQH